MTKYRVTCAKCGRDWIQSREPLPVSWCSDRCKELWFEARPAEKRAAARIEMAACVNQITSRARYPDHNIWPSKTTPSGRN